MTKGDIQWIKKQTHKSSNNLVDILDDEKKVANLNKDYHYRQSVLPRLEDLKNKIYLNTSEDLPDVMRDMDLVGFILQPLKTNPRYRLSSDEMKKCNELWKKYK